MKFIQKEEKAKPIRKFMYIFKQSFKQAKSVMWAFMCVLLSTLRCITLKVIKLAELAISLFPQNICQPSNRELAVAKRKIVQWKLVQ